MGRPAGKHPGEYERALMDKFSASVKNLLDIEKMSLLTLHALTGLTPGAVQGLRKGEAYVTTLVKVLDAMGFEVAFVKTKQRKQVSDDIDAINRLSARKKIEKDANRKRSAKKKRKSGKSGLGQAELRKIETLKGEF